LLSGKELANSLPDKPKSIVYNTAARYRADFSKSLELEPDNKAALKALETLNERPGQPET
jgi:hypothetical protein